MSKPDVLPVKMPADESVLLRMAARITKQSVHRFMRTAVHEKAVTTVVSAVSGGLLSLPATHTLEDLEAETR